MIPLDASLRVAEPAAGRGRLATFDCALLMLVGRVESAALTRLMRVLTRLGDTESWIVVGLALGVAAGPEGMRYMLVLGLGAGLATAASQVLKRLACRPRPSAASLHGFVARIDAPDEYSFPSGHTSAAFAVATGLAGEGLLLGLGFLALAAGIAASRVYLGAHYPLDVAVGVLIGVGAGLAARLLLDGAATLHLLTLFLVG